MKFLVFTLICCLSFRVGSAQNHFGIAPTLSVDSVSTINTTLIIDSTTASGYNSPYKRDVVRRNGVKMNLTSLAINNYNFSYERSVGNKVTLAGSYSFTPESRFGSLPLVKNSHRIKGIAGEQYGKKTDEITGLFNETKFTTTAYTGEIRFYNGKKPGARGWYTSVYGRYTSMVMSHLYSYEDSNGAQYDLPVNAKMSGFGGGIMIGAQWLVANRITLDWYIIGAHFGSLSGDVSAKSDLSKMSQQDKADLEAEIEGVIYHDNRKYVEATVTDEGVTGEMNGPFAGVRGFGFNIGVAF